MSLVRHLVLVSSLLVSSGLMAQPAKASSYSKKQPKQQASSVAPTKHKKRVVQAQIELLSGYRQDSLNFDLYAYKSIPGAATSDITLKLFQTNLVLGLKLFKDGYINAMGGYGVLGTASSHLTTAYPTVPYSISYHVSTGQGYAADWDVQGGYSFRIFTDYVKIAPELGYSYKRVSAHKTCSDTFAAPYVGGRLDLILSKAHKVGVYGFYDYYYCASRHDQNYYYQQFNGANIVSPTKVATGGSVNAYKVGAGATYQPYKHWTFGLKWQMFHEKTDPVTYLSRSQIYNVSEQLKWVSQQIQLSANFLF